MLRIFVGLVGLMALLLAPAAFLAGDDAKTSPSAESRQVLEASPAAK